LRLAVDGRAYLIFGKLAEGDSSDVFFARWVRRLGELVVIKILRCSSDRDLIAREYATLRRLRNSPSEGTPHFANLIPEPIGLGPVRFKREERDVSIFRWRSGFVHTAEDVKEEHPAGVDLKVSVWVFKRLLELLHWTHRSGMVHGAVLPPHVLIHPRDHGAMLIGWSMATPVSPSGTATLPAVSHKWKDWYRSTKDFRPADDLAMAARSALWLAGWSKLNPSGVFHGVVEVLREAGRGKYDDAWQLREIVTERAIDAWGPPKYVPLQMPGWPEMTEH
jgi:hypothetical protein